MANKRPSVVVTGANRGIGLELVSQYLADDWQVYGCCRRPELATQLAGLASNSALSIHQLDVGNPGSVKKLALALSEQSIDLLINNAGIYGGERQSFGDIDYAQWTRVLEVNTLGPYRVSTALANQVGNSELRLMVNVSSAMGSIERYTTCLLYTSDAADE